MFGATWLGQRFDRFKEGGRTVIDKGGRLDRSQSLLLSFDAGLTDRLSAGGVLPLRRSRLEGPNEASASGTGDLDLRLRWSATSPSLDPGAARLRILGGVSLPTGKEERKPSLDANLRFGAGTTAAMAGVEGSAAAGPRWTFFGRGDVRSPLGTSSSGIRYGRTLTVVAGLDAKLPTDRAGLILQTLWQRQGVDRLEGDAVPNRGGSFGYVSAGGRVLLGGGWQVSLLAQRLVRAKVRGFQLVAPWGVLVSASLSFGGP